MSNDQTTAVQAERFREALSLHQRGELQEAERRYRAILTDNEGHVGARIHLGLIRMQQGQLSEAERLFRETLTRNPDSIDARTALANGLLAQGRLEEALTSYSQALEIAPKHSEANYGAGTVLFALKRHDEATLKFRQAIASDSDYAEAYYGLACVLQAEGHHAEAIPLHHEALRVDSGYAEAKYALGIALEALDREEEAIECYRSAVASVPEFADAYNNLGIALQAVGRIDEARHAFEKAATLRPNRPAFAYNLFASAKVTADNPHLEALLALADRASSLPSEEQIFLHFALGKALRDIGEQDRAFRHFLEGNALKRRSLVYQEATEQRLLAAIARVFNAELMAAKEGQGDPSTLPVFIVGMPRSGSTLVEQILAAHGRVFAAGERLDLRDVLNSFGARSGTASPFPDRFAVATAGELRSLGADYVRRLKACTTRAVDDWLRITDKNLANFRLVGLIHLLLPNARIIHTVRGPLDTCLSCFETLFTADQPCTYDLGELGRFYRAYAKLMTHWRRVLPPHVMLELHYEELVSNFEREARRIVAHCGLAWDPACLAFYKAPRLVKTASSAQVRRPIYQSSIGRPRPPPELLRPLLEGLGPILPAAGGAAS